MGAGRGRKRTKKNRVLWRILKIQFLLQILVVALIIYSLIEAPLRNTIEKIQSLQAEAVALVETVSAEDFGTEQASVAYAADGTVISIWGGNRDVRYVPLSDMPQPVIDAVICMEDKRFYQHHGVDYKALLRAFFALVKNHGEITQGGSTVTMQLARTRYLTTEVSWQRKIEEIFIAQGLESRFDKEEILEFYLNNIYYGNGYYGIGTASRGYFGTDITELNLAQMIYLCAIPNNPSIYNPLTNSAKTEKRQRLILEKLLEEVYISEEDYTTAVSTAITLIEEPEKIEKNDYVETYASYCAARALMERSGFAFCYDFPDDAARKAYEEEYTERYEECQKQLSTEGYRIYTSLDLGMQGELQLSVDNGLSDFTEVNEEGVYTFQGAAVCIDNETGLVKAIVGGRSQSFDFYTLNRGYQSFRQPGSAVKPLIVYTPAFEKGYTPDTMVMDEPITGGPRNATGYFEGQVTLRYAVEQSINTVAWKLFEEMTPEACLSYLTEMRFSKIMREDYGLPSALGGFTIGVSPLEMAAAYSAIENEGVFRNPSCIVRIEAPDGSTVYEADAEGKRIYTQEAAQTMEAVLESVMESGTASPVRLEGIPCAGKTGTTNEWKDSWFVGYTEQYTTSVWVGYDMPKEIEGLTGPAYSGYIWKDFMETRHGLSHSG